MQGLQRQTVGEAEGAPLQLGHIKSSSEGDRRYLGYGAYYAVLFKLGDEKNKIVRSRWMQTTCVFRE